jgi:superfamily II DNA or RNA helicase
MDDDLDDEAFLAVDMDQVQEEHSSQLASRSSQQSQAEPAGMPAEITATSAVDRDPQSLDQRLLPFQREGVRQALAWSGRVLLGDEMGLGKTIQSIAIALHYQAEWPLLVLCPTSLSGSWADELERWCPHLLPGQINLVKSHHNGALQSAPVTILTYGLVTNGKEKERLAANVLVAGFKVVIVDEAHYLKGRDTVRSKLLLPILSGARRCVMLTGTPALNRPVELFPLLATLRPAQPEWKTYSCFVNRYCDAKRTFFGGRRGLDVSGSSQEAELYGLLSRLLMVRRLKADVLTQLPAKRRQRALVTLAPQATRALDALRRKADALPTGQSFDRQALLSKMVTELASAKVSAVAEYTLELIGSCDRLLFFAHHLCMLDGVEAAAASHGVRTLRIDGSTPSSERQAIVQKFEGAPAGKPIIFILSVLAAGQGLTLTSASTVVFGELRWVPGELLQAEDRAHRIGQRSAVNVHYVCAKGTVDEAMWRVLQRKVRTLGASLNGASSSLTAQASPWQAAGEAQAADVPPVGAPQDAGVCGVEEAAGGEVMGLERARQVQRMEAKRAAGHAAFNQLFAQRRAPSDDAARGAARESGRGVPSGAGTSSEPISLDEELPLKSGAGGRGADDAADAEVAEAWFAMSALTGRLHAFGDGPSPLPAGLGANAPAHALVDAEEEALPPALREPRVLRAAQIWLVQWDRLSLAQKASLADTPLRNPAHAAAGVGGKRSTGVQEVGGRGLSKGAGGSEGDNGSQASCAEGCSGGSGVDGSSGTSGTGAEGGGTVLSTTVFSTVRQTSTERWAEAHVPAGRLGVDFRTADWTTQGTRELRVWRQHFSLHSKLPHCLVCLAEHQPRPDSPFCSEHCAVAFGSAASQSFGRRQVYDRDRGVCAQCGFDAHELFRRVSALPTSAERMQALMQTHYSTLSQRMDRMLRRPKEGDYWEADHILPVAEGGGECDLTNLQTLCVPCHAAKTCQQQQDSKAKKRQKAASGTADLRSFFA